MQSASRIALALAFELAAGFLRQLPVDAPCSRPCVSGGDVWAKRASASIGIEHDRDERLIDALKRAAVELERQEQARS